MVVPRDIKKGDMVRIIHTPSNLDDRADLGTPQLLPVINRLSAVTKSKRPVESDGSLSKRFLIVRLSLPIWRDKKLMLTRGILKSGGAQCVV